MKMNVQQLIEQTNWNVLNGEGNLEVEITEPFCCDLLSIAMGKAPAGAAWVTVMANINTIAVAALTEVAVVILAEDVGLDAATVAKAKEQKILVVASKKSIFETAYEVKQLLDD